MVTRLSFTTYHQLNAKSKILIIIIPSIVVHVCADSDECYRKHKKINDLIIIQINPTLMLFCQRLLKNKIRYRKHESPVNRSSLSTWSTRGCSNKCSNNTTYKSTSSVNDLPKISDTMQFLF